MHKKVAWVFTICFTLTLLKVEAQVNPTYDLSKPKAFENRKLASELTPDRKINPVKRVKQNIVTHYNFHFNARNKLEKVIQGAKQAHRDTFTQLLQVHNFSLSQTAQQKQDLDSVILKSNNGILLHDLRNDWVDDLYLLMGKAYFYQQKFDSAFDVFQYINYNFQPRDKDDAGFEKTIGSNLNNSGNVFTVSTREKKISNHLPARNDALLWIAKTFIEMGQLDEARGMLETLSRDRFFPDRLRNSLYECKGDLFYRSRQYDSAAFYLGKSQSALDNNAEKSRRSFLVAQLYSLAGRLHESDSSFEKAISLTTDPVLEAYARINQIGMSAAGKDRETRINEHIAALIAMAGKEKYIAYRGIIYAAAAELEKSRNQLGSAVKLLIRSNAALPAEDAGTRNKNNIDIAEMSFESRDYTMAKKYYDSSNISGHPKEIMLNIRKSVVTDLVKHLGNVHREDSLQKIAALPEQERNKLLTELLKKIEKEGSDALPGQKNIGQTGQRARFAEDQTGSLFPVGQQKGEWYFNNASLKAQGTQSFQQKWGNRPNEDNWRRSSSAAASAKIPVSRTRVVRQEAPEDTDETLSVEKLAAGLPLTAKSMQDSKGRKANAARQLALLYRNKLGDCTSAIEWNEVVLQTNSSHPELESILYDLSLCYKEIGQLDKAGRYMTQLEQLSPSGNLIEKLKFPERALQKSNENAKAAKSVYEKIYNQFLAGDFKEAVSAKKTADSTFGQNAWTPQLMYIEAVYQIKILEDSLAIKNLNMIGQLFPSSPLAAKAMQLASVVSRRAEIEAELKNLQVVRLKEDSTNWLGEYANNKNTDQTKAEKSKETQQVIAKTEPPKKETINTAPSAVLRTDSASASQPTNLKAAPVSTVPPPIVKAEPVSVMPPAVVKNAPPAIPSKDSAGKITPQTPEIKPTPVAGYTFNPASPHAVIMFMYNVDIVYINEAKRALNRYHSIQYPEKELTVNNDKIGNTPFIIISFFQNAGEAMNYYDQTRPVAAKEIFPWLQSDKYKFFVLSPDHLKRMMEEEKTENFVKFIQSQFPGKF